MTTHHRIAPHLGVTANDGASPHLRATGYTSTVTHPGLLKHDYFPRKKCITVDFCIIGDPRTVRQVAFFLNPATNIAFDDTRVRQVPYRLHPLHQHALDFSSMTHKPEIRLPWNVIILVVPWRYVWPKPLQIRATVVIHIARELHKIFNPCVPTNARIITHLHTLAQFHFAQHFRLVHNAGIPHHHSIPVHFRPVSNQRIFPRQRLAIDFGVAEDAGVVIHPRITRKARRMLNPTTHHALIDAVTRQIPRRPNAVQHPVPHPLRAVRELKVFPRHRTNFR